LMVWAILFGEAFDLPGFIFPDRFFSFMIHHLRFVQGRFTGRNFKGTLSSDEIPKRIKEAEQHGFIFLKILESKSKIKIGFVY